MGGKKLRTELEKFKVGKSSIEIQNYLRDNARTRKKSKPRETWRRKVMGLKSSVS